MSDYTKTVDFAAKDALPTGNAGKVSKGTEVDTEFNNIATAIATKYDTPSDIPAATTTTVGVFELATTAEAQALTADDKYITPSKLNDVLGANGGFLADIQALTDPGADRVLGWDDSGAVVAQFGLGDGLVTDATPNIDVGATPPISVTTAAVEYDVSGLTELQGNALTSADLFYVDDGGAQTHKKMSYGNMGVPVATVAATSETLAAANMNTYRVYTAGTAVTVTLNTGVGVVGNVLILNQQGAGQVTVAGTATINAAIGLKTRAVDSVIVLVQTAANTWTLYGDAAA